MSRISKRRQKGVQSYNVKSDFWKFIDRRSDVTIINLWSKSIDDKDQIIFSITIRINKYLYVIMWYPKLNMLFIMEMKNPESYSN